MPNSTVIASDVAEDMIAKHETYLGGVPNVTSLLASAEDLSAVPSNSQDFVTCCYGYMFPSDKDKAVEEVSILCHCRPSLPLSNMPTSHAGRRTAC